MFKRGLLAVTFIAALGAASLGIGSKAMAWHDCNSGYGYVAANPYTPYAYGSAWGPRLAYYPTAVPVVRTYPAYYGRAYDGHRHHDHHHDGLTVSFGF